MMNGIGVVLQDRVKNDLLSSNIIAESNFGGTVDDLVFRWDNVCLDRTKKINSGYFKRSQYEDVRILNNVSGVVKSGSLMAVMGPSGSSKTTLIAAISMRIRGNFTGSLTLNDQAISKNEIISISGFVPQYDLAFETLTVFEHMKFMARMKMDRRTTDLQRSNRINELIQELNLAKCSDTMLSALSGGERKRLSLAVQLITNPPLLFCDEPTTGLDSWGAASVINQLRTLAETGRAIICSIHQPTSGIFDLFHRVLILAGGRVAYQGPVDEAAQFYKKNGFQCPVGFNEAEFLVNVVSHERQAQKLSIAWQEQESNEDVYENDKSRLSYHMKKFKDRSTIQKPGKLVQLYWLLWRASLSAKRDYKMWIVEFLSLIGIALILATPYINILKNIEQRDIQNVQGLLYIVICENIFVSIYIVFMWFPAEIPIFLRDTANGLYDPGPYYLSKMILILPRSFIEPLIYSTLVYYIVGLRGGFYGFVLFSLPIIFSSNCANAYGSWLSASFESIMTASLVSVPIDLVTCLYAGNFLNLNSIPAATKWIKYLSIFFYTTEAVSILQWETVTNIECDARNNLPCFKTGPEVLKAFGYKTNDYLIDLLGLSVIYFGFHIFGFIALYRRSKEQPVY